MKKLFILKNILRSLGLNSFAMQVKKQDFLYKKAITEDEIIKLKSWFGGDYSKLSFNNVFDGKLRKLIPFNSENIDILYKIVNALKINGWEPAGGFGLFKTNLVNQRRNIAGGGEETVQINVAELQVRKVTTRTIPVGPKKGETEEVVKVMTISKALELPELRAPELGITKEIKDWWAKNQTKYSHDENWTDISDVFAKDSGDVNNIFSNKKYIIISRDPIDVLKMSDHRKIESCHSEGGSYFHCALAESRGAGAISYVVTESELKKLLEGEGIDITKIDLNNFDISQLDNKEIFEDTDRGIDGIIPISRVRLRKIKSESGEISPFFVPEKRIYGFKLPGLTDVLVKWSWDSQKNIFKDEEGNIKIPDARDLRTSGGSYFDNTASSLVSTLFEAGSEIDGFKNTFKASSIIHDLEEEREFDEEEAQLEAQFEEDISETIRIVEAARSNAFASGQSENIKFYADVDRDGDNIYYSASVTLTITLKLYGWSEIEIDDYEILGKSKDGKEYVIELEEYASDIVENLTSSSFDLDNINALQAENEPDGTICVKIKTDILPEVYSTDDISQFFNSFRRLSDLNDIVMKYLKEKDSVTSFDEDIKEILENKNFTNLNLAFINDEKAILEYKIDSNNLPNIVLNYYDAILVSMQDFIFKITDYFYLDIYQAFQNVRRDAKFSYKNLEIKNKIINFINEELKKQYEESKKQLKFDFYKEDDYSEKLDINLLEKNIEIILSFKEMNIRDNKISFYSDGLKLNEILFKFNINNYEIASEYKLNTIKIASEVLDKNIKNISDKIISDLVNKSNDFNIRQKNDFENTLEYYYNSYQEHIDGLLSSSSNELKRFALWVKSNWNNGFTDEQKYVLINYHIRSLYPNSNRYISWDKNSRVPRASERTPLGLHHVFESFNGIPMNDPSIESQLKEA